MPLVIWGHVDAISHRLYERFVMNKFARLVGGSGLVAAYLVGSPAFAVIDIAAATTGISDASTAVLAVLAAMITMAAAVFGVYKVLGLINKK